MAFGVLPRSGWLLAIVTLALAGCSNSTPPSATLIDPAAPTAPTTIVFASITPPPETTTTAAPTTTLPSTTLPAAINGLVPTTDEEREVLVAADHLYAQVTQLRYLPFQRDSQLLPTYVDPQLSKTRKFLARRTAKGEISRPGSIQIVVFRSIRKISQERWSLVVCDENDGVVVNTRGTPDPSDDELLNTGLGGGVIDYTLQLTPTGYRIADGVALKTFKGPECEP